MVEILCPHCEKEIELDDDASGEFECPYCEGEFEWNVKPKKAKVVRDNSNPVSGLTSISHLVHGVSGILLLIGLFSNWIVWFDGMFGVSPFGASISLFGYSETTTWFELMGEEGVGWLPYGGILFMLIIISAFASQICHLVFRFVVHKIEYSDINVSSEMAYRSYTYRWHTSLVTLILCFVGVLISEISAVIFASDLLEFSYPRPSFLAVLILVSVSFQFYLMNQELANE
jgi:DNA-directed RNA polymerase subunit RPC12/RpoP